MSPFRYENDKETNYPSLFQELIVNISYGDYFSSYRHDLFCGCVPEEVFKLMKKKISTEQELFFQVAAHGDAAAFFSMISPALRDYFLKLCSHGDSVEESAQKVCETAETLFKKLQHAHPDNFDHWIETEFSSLSHNGNSEHEVILDKNLLVQSEKVLKETQKVLFRVASTIKNKRHEKGVIVFLGRHKIATSFAIIAILASIASIILYGYYGFRLDLSVLNAKSKKVQQNDSTATVSLDSTKKVDSIASAAALNTPVQEPKPTTIPNPPKPRPRATYTTPASESEGSGTYQSPRTSSYDQTQQSVLPRSERINQSSSYSSQNQSTENANTSSYYSSGNSTYPGQQSTQSQSTLEQNQP
jgi:hypothetical protein